MASKTMHAAVLDGIGRVPRYGLFPVPEQADGQAVITVTAAALKPSDRLMAGGVGYVPASFPAVAGLDGVGRLRDGSRVGFFGPLPPHGGMAQQTLVRAGTWLPVSDGADDVTAAALLNPGMAAWKSVVWEGRAEPGQSVLVLGATGTSGRIAAQLAAAHGARVVAAGRNPLVLAGLAARGVVASTMRADLPHAELAEAIAAAGPYDLIIDYLWGAPAEAVFAALLRLGRRPGGPGRIRYLQVGMSAGQQAALPAMTLRAAPVELVGSGAGGPAALSDAAAAFDDLLRQAGSGRISIDVDAVPLADVQEAWTRPPGGGRIVFVP
jgi:NADPH:quinone reductase-like Zn-dependent oxidoreductase